VPNQEGRLDLVEALALEKGTDRINNAFANKPRRG
jgi:hypothetical protein